MGVEIDKILWYNAPKCSSVGGKTVRERGDMVLVMCYNGKMSKFPERVTIQLSEEEAEQIREAAAREGLSVSAFIRRRLLLFLRQQLEEEKGSSASSRQG